MLTAPPRVERGARMRGVRERLLDAADVLVVLVSLAGEQDDVGRVRIDDGMAHRVGAVLDHVDLVMADDAGEDLGNDEVGRLERAGCRW